MEIGTILKEIDKEISLLQQARALLTESDKPSHKVGQRRKMSAETRKRMADAQLKRWAAIKYSQKA